MKNTVTSNKSCNFDCQRCGWCCKNVNINISHSDILRWAKENRIDILNKVSYIDHEDPKKKGFYIVETVQAPKQACPYLTTKDGLAVCSIYETRPRSCKEFPEAHTKDEKQKIECPARKDYELDKKALFELKRDQSLDFRLAEDRKEQLISILEKARQIATLLGEIKEFGDDPNEDLWVDTLGTERTAWTEVGTTPFLSIQDQPTNYIWTTTKKAEHGDFTFADHIEGSGTINSVTLYVYCQSADTRTIGFFIWDGTDWTEYPLTLPISWGWVNVLVPVLDSWGKIDGAKLYVKQPNQADRSDIDAAYILVDYTPTAQTGYEDRNLSLDINLQGYEDRSLSLDINYLGYADRSLSLDINYLEYTDRSFLLDIKGWAYDDRNLSLDIEQTGFEDRSLILEIEKIDYADRDLSLDINYLGYEDRSLSLEIELTDYEDRSLVLDINYQGYEDRNFTLEIEIISYEDRNLTLDIDYLGYADRDFSLTVELTDYEDRSLVLDVEPLLETGYEDRNLSLEIAGWGYTDRDFSLEIELTGYTDRSLSLDINYLEYADRSMSLNIEHIDYSDRSLILEIESTAYEDRSLTLDIELTDYEDRSLSLEVELTDYFDRSLELMVVLPGYEDRNLSLEVEFIEFEDRSFVLDVELLEITGYEDRSLVVLIVYQGYENRSFYLNVHRRKPKITITKESYAGTITKKSYAGTITKEGQ